MNKKEYLGDGAYADIEGGDLVLTAENGVCATDRIVFEPEVLLSLVAYIGKWSRAIHPEPEVPAPPSNHDLHVLQLQDTLTDKLRLASFDQTAEEKAAYLLDFFLTCDLADPDLRIWYEAQKALDQQGEN